MQSNKKKLASHPFAKKVMEKVRPLLEASIRKLQDVAQQGKVRSKEKDELWEYEWYGYEVSTHLSAITSGSARLEQSQNFIRTFPRPRSYEKEGINQQTWIEYHYSYYVITFVSLFDMALILTNSVFRLGNRERDCKADLIMMNRWVRQTPVKQALADLDQLIKPYRESRNLHVHRGKVPDIVSIMKSDELDWLNLYGLIQTQDEQVIDRVIIDCAYKRNMEELCERLQEETGKIYDTIWRLFDGLLSIYDEKSTALHEKWRGIFQRELECRRKQKT
jgi:HEPN superfamily protein